MDFLKQLYPAAMMTLSLILVTGVAYPLGVTVLANVFFKEKAQGSLIVKNGEVVGSKLIGQPFTGDAYFHSRPSAAGNVGYDGTASGGTNLGPTSKKLIEEKVASVADAIRAENPSARSRLIWSRHPRRDSIRTSRRRRRRFNWCGFQKFGESRRMRFVNWWPGIRRRVRSDCSANRG
jgi:hypothetical protein